MDEPLDDGEAHSGPFKPGNTAPDGNYIVGKNRPPQHSRFAVGDGRRRGRRAKGQRNFDTEFLEEAARKVTIREGGRERRVSKLRSAIIRAFDNAGAKGQNQAIAAIFAHSSRIGDKAVAATGSLSPQEDALVDAWLAERLVLPLEDPEEAPDRPIADAESSEDGHD